MKKYIIIIWAVYITLPVFAQERRIIEIPNLEGFVTLKCDFHMHTVFSDGVVWPTVRVDEAYYNGLDAIAITDHIEYRPNKGDVIASHNRSYEIALSAAKARGIILIRGSEITRDMPPGHNNAIFLTNSDELDKPDYMDAFRAAKTQNAFIFWNHPGWTAQQPDTTMWWPEHTQLLEQGMMYGIEVVNWEYYPEAHRWCLEKKLTMIGSTDVHQPMQTHLDMVSWKHRTMTLVFARSATPEAIREALNERRTAIYHNDHVIGEEKYLKELFENALEWKVEKTNKKEEMRVMIRNKSDLTIRLKNDNHDPRVVYLRNTDLSPFTLTPKGVRTFTVRLLEGITGGDVNFIVENFFVEPNEGMKYTLRIDN